MRKSNKLLKIYEPDTYPQALLNLVARNRNLYSKYEPDPTRENLLSDFADFLEEDVAQKPVEKFIERFEKELEDIWIEGFHITRTFPDKNFLNKFYLSRGLQFPDEVFQYEYFKEVLAQINCSEDVARMFFSAFSEKLPRREDRMRTISVFSYPSEFVLHSLDNGYINLYGGETSVFGELGRLAQDRMPNWRKTIFAELATHTCPHIVHLKFRITQLYNGSCERPADYVIKEMIGILASKHFSWNTAGEYCIDANNSVFCAQLGQQIPSEDILGIYSIEEWEQIQYSSKKKRKDIFRYGG